MNEYEVIEFGRQEDLVARLQRRESEGWTLVPGSFNVWAFGRTARYTCMVVREAVE